MSSVTSFVTVMSTKKWEHYKNDKDFSCMCSLHHFTICHISVVIRFSYVTLLCHRCRWVIIGALMYPHVVPDSQIVNVDWYVEVQKHKRPHYCNNQWKLHYDNTLPHMAQHVLDFFTSHSVEVIPHAPYTLDLGRCDFFPISCW